MPSQPTRYAERLLVDKAVELRPAPGAHVEIVWETDRPYESTIVCTADGAVVVGLTVRHASPSIANNYAVQLAGCSVRIESCDISSATGSGLGVEGGSSQITDCALHDCERSGAMLFTDLEETESRATLRGCTLRGNKLHGVVVREGAEPVVRDNAISGNGGYGLALQGCGGEYAGNSVAGNRRGAVAYNLLDGVDLNALGSANGLQQSELIKTKL